MKRKLKSKTAEQSKDKEYEDNPSGYAKRWNDEFTYAKSAIKKWHKEGDKVVKRFLDERTNGEEAFPEMYSALNLFHSNVVTLMSMLYGSIPKVEVTRAFADAEDDVARVAAVMATRMLNQDIQDAGEDYISVLRNALQDRLLPGLGTARVRYDFKEETNEYEPELGNDGEELVAGFTENTITDEWVDTIYTHWKDVLWSPARTYSELRWKAFRSYMFRDELVKRFGDIGKDVPLTSKGPVRTERGADEKGECIMQAEVWEIWDKNSRCVYWYVENYDKTLDKKEDPLELDGFWPDPPPFIANVTTTKWIPRSDYALSQDLYQEIDKLQTRISLLTDACKLVGVYDKSNEEIKRIFNEGVENDLIPVDNWAMFGEKGGLDGSIDWVPLEDVTNTISVLTEKQSEKIQQLYQVTGMSDIMRGASQPYEAASTSKAKVQFASIRVQALQDEFARFASDLQALKMEIIQKHFQPYCIIEQSNIMSTPDAELAEQAIQLLKDPKKARWKVRIRPESLAMADYAQLKADRMEYINGLAMFMQSAAPLVQLDKKIVPVLLKLLQWGLAAFKGSQEIEGVLDRAIDMYTEIAKAPEQEKPDPKIEALKMEMQMKQQEHQAKMQSDQQKNQMAMAEMQQKFQLEVAKMQQEIQQDQQKFQLEIKQMLMEFMFKKQTLQLEAQAETQEQAAQFAFNTAERKDEAATNREERSHAAAVQMVSDSEKAKASRGDGGGSKE